ncbi:MAG: GlsB/YeaQ/YmgE family stress response membrane protein [Bergeyella sp.]
MLGILSWIIFGLVAGAIAKFIMPGNQNMGWLWTIILGIVGAFVGGWIGSFLGWGTADSFDFRSMLLAVGGALLVLWIYGIATKR